MKTLSTDDCKHCYYGVTRLSWLGVSGYGWLAIDARKGCSVRPARADGARIVPCARADRRDVRFVLSLGVVRGSRLAVGAFNFTIWQSSLYRSLNSSLPNTNRLGNLLQRHALFAFNFHICGSSFYRPLNRSTVNRRRITGNGAGLPHVLTTASIFRGGTAWPAGDSGYSDNQGLLSSGGHP